MARKTLFLIAATVIFSPFAFREAGYLRAQSAGNHVAEWLKAGVGARSIAMAESYVAISDDASGIFCNPAALSKAETSQIMIQYGNWLANTGYHAFAYLLPITKKESTGNNSDYQPYEETIGPFGIRIINPFRRRPQPDFDEVKKIPTGGAFGLGVTYLDYGQMTRTTDLMSTEPDSGAPSFTANSYCIFISYGQVFGGSASVGFTLKKIKEQLDTYSAEGIGGDLGFLFVLNSKLRLGVAVQNMGSASDGSELPQNIKAGVKFGQDTLVIGGEVNQASEGSMKLSTGLEFTFKQLISFRLGYVLLGMQDIADGGLIPKGLSFGLGVKTKSITVDFALTGWGNLGYGTNLINTPLHVSLTSSY